MKSPIYVYGATKVAIYVRITHIAMKGHLNRFDGIDLILEEEFRFFYMTKNHVIFFRVV